MGQNRVHTFPYDPTRPRRAAHGPRRAGRDGGPCGRMVAPSARGYVRPIFCCPLVGSDKGRGMSENTKSAKLAEMEKGTDQMENFKTYGLAQFAMGNEAKFRAYVSLALDMVATVKQWDMEVKPKPKSKAECEAALSIALTLSKVKETTARRIIGIVSGLAKNMPRDMAGTLVVIKLEMEAPHDNSVLCAVNVLCAALQADGVENLGFLEAYAKGGKPALAAIKAETEAKIAAIEAKAAMTEAEAAEAAEAEAAEAAEKAADQTPRSKAAKQAGAILSSLAKHGELMTAEELTAIAATIATIQLARLSVADDVRAKDIAADMSAKAEAAAEARATRATRKAA